MERPPLFPVQRFPVYARPLGVCQFSGCTGVVVRNVTYRGLRFMLCERHGSRLARN